jgi:hypothetical protein
MKYGVLVLKMIAPRISARMKEPYNLTSAGIDARHVRPFESIASAAAEREIREFRFSAMLPGDHMIQDMLQSLCGFW